MVQQARAIGSVSVPESASSRKTLIGSVNPEMINLIIIKPD